MPTDPCNILKQESIDHLASVNVGGHYILTRNQHYRMDATHMKLSESEDFPR
jgi:hypothetical protein